MDLIIESCGLVTSLGHGVVESAAAARAGIVRPDDLDGVVGFDPEEMTVPVSGHPVRGLTEGFEQTGRWLQLAYASLMDLTRDRDGASFEASMLSKAAFLPVIPEIDYERFKWPEEQILGIVKDWLVAPLRTLTGLALPCEDDWIFQGSSGFARALIRAEELLRTGKYERAVVLAVDSWLDTPGLMALEESGRIKGPETPAGLMPGESAACVSVALPAAAAESGSVRITSAVHAATDPRPLADEAQVVPVSQRLGRVLGSQLADALADGPAHVYSDANGEEWRAHIHGMALVAAKEARDVDGLPTSYPCASFGDIGAVHAAASACLFEQSIARSYAPAGARGVILCAGEDGSASSIGVSARE